ncbi:MAG TPA: Hpt domain-containing protein, partial [Magnetospirillum sp.]|nr:Hpt domain-containing protein [Magnetospirillum sp.]
VAARRPRPVLLVAADPANMAAFLGAGADGVLPARPSTDALASAIAHAAPTHQDLEAVLGHERLENLRGLLRQSLGEQATLLTRSDLGAKGLEEIAHRIKGSAANLGLAELAQAAERAMQTAGDTAISANELDYARRQLYTAIHKHMLEAAALAQPNG